ncbi:MAG TPA: DUF4156 domain-containing protein [Rhodanobacteraceae bacterium]|nr:DUF4156 domain-containing protein [Rhodanobacteraceae bacterium]
MKSTLRWAPLAGAILLSACTYGIVLDPGGQNVRVAWNGNTGIRPCRDIGKVTVSVLSRIGPVDRNDIKVRDELEIMARNQAAQMRADTITPLGEPRDGEQSWEAWQCGTVAPQGYAPAYPQPNARSGAPVEDVPAYGPSRSAYPPPAANAPQPTPFGAPVPAGGAQTYPLSGSTS